MKKRTWKAALSFVLVLCIFVGLLAPSAGVFAVTAKAEAPAPDTEYEIVSDTLEWEGWLYQLCSDGYAQLVGYADPAATELTLPSSVDGHGVVRLGENAFGQNTALRTVTAPVCITLWPDSAFEGCTGLTVCGYNGSAALEFARRVGLNAENLSALDFFDDIIDFTQAPKSQWSVSGPTLLVREPWSRLLREGTRLFLPGGSNPANGRPVQVESVTVADGQTTALVTDLDFMESVETYHAENVPLYADYNNIVILQEGVSVESAGGTAGQRGSVDYQASLPLIFSVNYKLNDNMSVEGSIGYSPSITMSADYSFFNVNSVSFKNESEVSVDIVFKTNVKKDYFQEEESKIPIAKVPLASATVVSAWLEIQLKFSFSGEISVVYEVKTSESVEFHDGKITHSKSKIDKGLNIDAAVKLGVELGPSITVSLGFSSTKWSIDIAQISVSVGISGKLKSSTETPCTDVKVEGYIKLEAQIGILKTKNTSNGKPGWKEKISLAFGGEVFKISWTIWEGHAEYENHSRKFVDSCTKKDTRTVTFYTGSNVFIEKAVVKAGSLLTKPSDPVRKGATFAGWYVDKAYTTRWNFETDKVEANLTLYAKWEGTSETSVAEPEMMSGEESMQFLEYTVHEEGYVSITNCYEIQKYDKDGKFDGWIYPVAITVPDYIEGLPVKEIRGDSFVWVGDSLEAVHLPDSVESIGRGAFSGCEKLSSINYPRNWKSVPGSSSDGVFTGCSKLTSMVVPEGVTAIPAYAFDGSEITSFTLPSTLVEIGSSAFAYSKLQSIKIPDSVESIGANAFAYCDKLSSINYPRNWKSADNNIFQGCSKLTTMVVPEGVTAIPELAFCRSEIASFTLPSTLMEIGRMAFYDCDNLCSIQLPDSVETIGGGAFSDCTNLSSVNYPRNWETANGNIFHECPKLTTMVVPEGITMIPEYAFYGASFTSVSLPSTLIEIGSYAFNQSKLQSIVLPDSVVWIGYDAFAGSENLSSINYPRNWGDAGTYIFQGCPKLTTMVVPEGITRIPYSAFSYSEITTITLPSTLVTVGFDLPLSLHIVYLYENSTNVIDFFKTNYPNVELVYLKSKMAQVTFDSRGGSAVGTISFYPNRLLTAPPVPTKDGYCFTGWYRDIGLTQKWNFATDRIGEESIILYAGWETLKKEFGYHKSGSGIVIDSYHGSAYDLVIPEEIDGLPVTGLGDGCVPGGVATLTLPKTVREISSSAFDFADSLYSIAVNSANTAFLSRDGVLYSGKTLFRYPQAKAAGTYSIPSGTTRIAAHAFYGCSRLTALSVPASVQTVDKAAIYNTESLQEVRFAADVTTIGELNFQGTRQIWVYGPLGQTNLASYADKNYVNYNLYEITYVQDGAVLGNAMARAGEKLGNLMQPAESELTFKGWSTDPEGNTLWNFDSGVMPAEDLVLYAVWKYDFMVEPATGGVRLTRYTGNRSRIIVPEAVYGEKVLSIASGCFPDKTVVLVGNKGSVAQQFAKANGMSFSALTYTVTFQAAGGTIPAPLTLCATDAITLPATTRTGYRFTGWYKDAQCSTLWSGKMPASDLTLYAGWEKTDESIADVPFTFANVTDGLTITGYTGTKMDITVPDQINGVAVVAIAERAFAGNQVIRNLTVPASVKSIDASAFADSTLTAIQIAGAPTIGDYAFSGCRQLTGVTLSDSIRQIGRYAFQDCTALLSITLPTSLTGLQEGTFLGCSWLTDVSLPEKLKTIARFAFAECSHLPTIRLGSGLESVDSDAFCGCTALQSFTGSGAYFTTIDGVLFSDGNWSMMCYPEGKKTAAYTVPQGTSIILEGAMRNSQVVNLTLNSDLLYIDRSALEGSQKLETVTFGSQLKEIRQYAFRGCPLKDVTIGANTQVQDNAFDPAGLTIRGTAGSAAQTYALKFGIRFVDPGTVEITDLSVKNALALEVGQSVVLSPVLSPSNTTERTITWSSDNPAVAVVDANGRVEAHAPGTAVILLRAVNGLSASCTVTVTEPVLEVTKVVLSSGRIVAHVGEMIPLSASVLPAGAQSGITWTVEDPTVAVYQYGCVVPLAVGTTKITAAADNGVSAAAEIVVAVDDVPVFGNPDFVLPAQLTTIEESAFASAAFTVVKLPEGAKTIGSNAFANCAKLKQIYIPASVTSIADSSFTGCSSGLQIFGAEGSAAQRFALAHHFQFIPW